MAQVYYIQGHHASMVSRYSPISALDRAISYRSIIKMSFHDDLAYLG